MQLHHSIWYRFDIHTSLHFIHEMTICKLFRPRPVEWTAFTRCLMWNHHYQCVVKEKTHIETMNCRCPGFDITFNRFSFQVRFHPFPFSYASPLSRCIPLGCSSNCLRQPFHHFGHFFGRRLLLTACELGFLNVHGDGSSLWRALTKTQDRHGWRHHSLPAVCFDLLAVFGSYGQTPPATTQHQTFHCEESHFEIQACKYKIDWVVKLWFHTLSHFISENDYILCVIASIERPHSLNPKGQY